jgi:hypothetical protein
VVVVEMFCFLQMVSHGKWQNQGEDKQLMHLFELPVELM